MKPQKAVVRETVHIAIGTFALVAVMLAVFAALGAFDISVLLGGLWGGAIAVVNFFALGMTVQSSVQGIQSEDDAASKRAKAKMQLSYSLRMLAEFALAVLGIAVFHFNAVACVLPLVFPRVVIMVLHLRQRREERNSRS